MSNEYSTTPGYPITAEDSTSNSFENRSGIVTEDHLTRSAQIAIGIFLGLVVLLTIGGNLLVITSFCRYGYLRTYTKCYVLNLAVADLLVGCVDMPLYGVVLILGYWPFGDIFCDVFVFLDHALSHVSVVSTMVISLDRFVALTKPFMHRRRWQTKRNATLLISLTYLIPTVIWFPLTTLWPVFAGTRTAHVNTCSPQYVESLAVSILSPVLFFWIPLVTVSVLYYHVHKSIKKTIMLTNARRMNVFSTLQKQNRITNHDENNGETSPKKPSEPSLGCVLNQVDTGLECVKSIGSVVTSQIEIAIISNLVLSTGSVSKAPPGSSSTPPEASGAPRLEGQEVESVATEENAFSLKLPEDGSKRLEVALSEGSIVASKREFVKQIPVYISDTEKGNFEQISDSAEFPPGCGLANESETGGCTLNRRSATGLDFPSDAAPVSTCTCDTDEGNSSQNGSDSWGQDRLEPPSGQGITVADEEDIVLSVPPTWTVLDTDHEERDNIDGTGTGIEDSTPEVADRALSGEHGDKKAPLPGCGSHAAAVRSRSQDSEKRLRNENIRATKILSGIIAAMTVAWLPWATIVIVISLCEDCIPGFVYTITVFLGYTNSTLNPICYAIVDRTFRRAFKSIMCQRYARNGASGSEVIRSNTDGRVMN